MYMALRPLSNSGPTEYLLVKPDSSTDQTRMLQRTCVVAVPVSGAAVLLTEDRLLVQSCPRADRGS